MAEPTPVPAPHASVARGLSIVAAVALGVVVLQSIWPGWPAEASSDPAVCTRPVELTDPAGSQLGCADRAELARCGPLAAGDRVLLSGDGCSVDPGGMRGGWRLLRRLPLDVNRADAGALVLLDGVGPAIARAIIEERTARGPFASVDGLQRVTGIGPSTVERLRPYVTVAAAE